MATHARLPHLKRHAERRGLGHLDQGTDGDVDDGHGDWRDASARVKTADDATASSLSDARKKRGLDESK